MRETAAIVAAASGGAVGVGGLISVGWGAVAQRRWQAREERTIDLRTVLESAAENLGKAMFVANEGHAELERTGQVSDARRRELIEAQRGIVLAGNQIGVRRGPRSDEHGDAATAERAYLEATAKALASS